MAYVAVISEGGLFPSDLLDRIATGNADGQRASDFGLPGSQRLTDETQGAFSDARSFWDSFLRRTAHSRESLTTLTRKSWVEPLLERLSFELIPQRTIQAGTESYPIAYQAGTSEAAPPVHVVALDQPLDRRSENSRRSPHALVQEYLNHSDALWGIVTNGERLRLLRNSARIARPTYVEFDLRGVAEGNLYSEFVLLYRILHRSRLPHGATDAHECLLERYYQQGIDDGGRVRDHLREGVEAALKELGTGLLAHPDSGKLRETLKDGTLKEVNFYRELLRLVYRLLFLMVAEERRLIFPPTNHDQDLLDRQAVYAHYYSLTHLRDRSDRYFAEDYHSDLWQGLLQTFRLLQDESAVLLGLSPLDGELFGPEACMHLQQANCENSYLLRAIHGLSTFTDQSVRRRVNYAGLDVEELGSVYESLLDYLPHVSLEGSPSFDLIAGSERRQTGSYYTPPELVRELVDHALVPVMEERLATVRTPEEKQKALLDLHVCDPASGSGHFLLATARRIARELAKLRTGEEEPTPEAFRVAVRDVVRNCIYAVDKNPLAVDLCKVALWIEGHTAGLPLSFLDQHVKCGDSLVGVFDLDVLTDGIPDEAYAPVTGDDKKAATAFRRRNKEERGGQLPLGVAPHEQDTSRMARDFHTLAEMEERTPSDVQAKQGLYESLRRRGGGWWNRKVACDLWTWAFFAPLVAAKDGVTDSVPTTGSVRSYLLQPRAASGQLVGRVVAESEERRFFHWPLEFPEVFRTGGFDVVLGNPPWERIRLEEDEFFGNRDAAIAQATNKAERQRLIASLSQRNRDLAHEFSQAQHDADATSKFIRTGGRFPYCGRGDVNTYAVFAELARHLTSPSGVAGIIVPTGIATDDTTKLFFKSILDSRSLVSLYDFDNSSGFFPAVKRHQQFCLLTMTGRGRSAHKGAEFAFLLRGMEDLYSPGRKLLLTREDIALVNPNTLTCPVFRTRRDAEIVKSLYRIAPILVQEGPAEINPWGVSFLRMFDVTNDAHLFQKAEQLEKQGFVAEQGTYRHGQDCYVPLFDAKMAQQYNHRAANLGSSGHRFRKISKETVGVQDLRDPHFSAIPLYYVPEDEVDRRLGTWKRGWLAGFKDITGTTSNMLASFAIIPRMGVGNGFPIIHVAGSAENSAVLVANLNSLVCEYVLRFKIQGLHLNYFYLKQLPVIPPDGLQQAYPWSGGQSAADWIAKRVLRLSYTAWDLKEFAEDMGYSGHPFAWSEEERLVLRSEIEAAYFKLYQVPRGEIEYFLDNLPVIGGKSGDHKLRTGVLSAYDSMP